MNKELENFLSDLIILIQEQYNESLGPLVDENIEDKAFKLGSNFAYYDVLTLIESQLKVNQLELCGIKRISPTLGKKI